MNSVEDTGPLTPEQKDLLDNHPCKGMVLAEAEKELRWHQGILTVTSTSDPSYARSKKMCADLEVYINLVRRFNYEGGVAEVIDLKEKFDIDSMVNLGITKVEDGYTEVVVGRRQGGIDPSGQLIKPTTVDEILERLGVALPQPVVSRHVTDFDEL